jgi:hypothetical protein
MLTKVVVDNMQGHTLTLDLFSWSNGYILKDVEGLDPVKATIMTSTFAQLDGSQSQGARRDNRNIVITAGLVPDFSTTTVQSLRTSAYSVAMPKTFVKLSFYDDDVLTATIEGQVESCEATPFAKDPEMKISVICFDPSFSAPTETTVNGNTVSTSTEQTIVYPGSVEVGYLLTLAINRSLSDFTIYNRRPNGDITSIPVTFGFLTSDSCKVSTVAKDKYCTNTRTGVTDSILYAVSTTAKWSPLYPGNNYIRVYAAGAAIPFTLKYTAKYGGL